jgi:DNA replication protein DnaC
MRLSRVHPDARKVLLYYLAHYRELAEQGYSLALTGAQGTGKTAVLALIAEAAHRYLPLPVYNQWETTQTRLVMYQRTPLLMRMLSDFLPARERTGWEQQYQELIRCRVLLLDEFHVVPDNDRASSMLLDLIDTRISEARPTHLAMNARWQELRTDKYPKLLQAVREKMEATTRELVIPGASRRTPWGWE